MQPADDLFDVPESVQRHILTRPTDSGKMNGGLAESTLH
jgi:hypothetical protein